MSTVLLSPCVRCYCRACFRHVTHVKAIQVTCALIPFAFHVSVYSLLFCKPFLIADTIHLMTTF